MLCPIPMVSQLILTSPQTVSVGLVGVWHYFCCDCHFPPGSLLPACQWDGGLSVFWPFFLLSTYQGCRITSDFCLSLPFKRLKKGWTCWNTMHHRKTTFLWVHQTFVCFKSQAKTSWIIYQKKHVNQRLFFFEQFFPQISSNENNIQATFAALKTSVLFF